MKKSSESREFKLLYYRATIDSALFTLKTILILNSGALVSILLAVSRSATDGIGHVLIGPAYLFFWGLTAAMVAVISFVPFGDIEEFGKYFKPNYIHLAILALSIMLSCAAFLIGAWETVTSLDTFFIDEAEK